MATRHVASGDSYRGREKVLALWELACRDAAEKPRFLPIGLSGVWNWKGIVGIEDGPHGEREPITGPIPDLDRIACAERKMTILFDSNVQTNKSVRAARGQFARESRRRGAQVFVANIPLELGVNGIDDVAGTIGPEKALEIIAGAKAEDWHDDLLRTSTGQQISCVENLAICLERHPEWVGGLRFDEFRNRVVVTDKAPKDVRRGPLDDHSLIDIRRWLERHFLQGSVEKIHSGIDAAARANPYHPIREYLQPLIWDGNQRLNTLFQTYFGAKGESKRMTTYLAEVAKMFLISAVARVFTPGCQVDHLLVPEGPQGIYKSNALRALFGPEYFTDQMPSLDSKDASLQLNGKWCVEFSEFARLSKHEAAVVKAFVTRRVDTYRKPYGRETSDVPRQCVFAATVNDHEYLVDDENRRYWPVACTSVNVEAIAQDRDQIWAEATALYLEGVHWWPTAELCKMFKAEQEKREIENPYFSNVANWIHQQSKDEGWNTAEILRGLDVHIEQFKSLDQHIAKAMTKLGYEKTRPDPREPRVWKKKDRKTKT